MGGHVDAVRVLLTHGAAVEGARRHVCGAAAGLGSPRAQQLQGPGADHVGVARLLIAAGSPLEWMPPRRRAPNVERTLDGLSNLRRDAGAAADSKLGTTGL